MEGSSLDAQNDLRHGLGTRMAKRISTSPALTEAAGMTIRH